MINNEYIVVHENWILNLSSPLQQVIANTFQCLIHVPLLFFNNLQIYNSTAEAKIPAVLDYLSTVIQVSVWWHILLFADEFGVDIPFIIFFTFSLFLTWVVCVIETKKIEYAKIILLFPQRGAIL